MKKFGIFKAIMFVICALLISGCNSKPEKTEDDREQADTVVSMTDKEPVSDSVADEKEEDKTALPVSSDKEEDETADTDERVGFGKIGSAVDAGNMAYYWKFSDEDFGEGALFASFEMTNDTYVELVRFENGVETVVAEVETPYDIAVTQDKVFFVDDGCIKFVNHGDTQEQTAVDGFIEGITEDGKKLIYKYYSDDNVGQLCALDTDTLETVFLASYTEYVATHNGIVYHTPYTNYDKPQNVISLYGADSETGENRHIYTTPATEDDTLMFGGTSIAHRRFNDEYIYFSHGQVQGTGAFYSGGDIIRVRYDGSDAEILADNSDSYVDAEFTVNPDGSITQNEIGTGGLYNFRRQYTLDTEHNLIWFNGKTGAPEVICSIFPDDNYASSDCNFVNVTDKYAFFITHYCTLNPEMNVGWRDYYEREKSVFYMVDRESGEIVTSYEF